MTKEQIESAKLITAEEYLSLISPEFMGQTRLDKNGFYRMYWKDGDSFYYTINSI